ncbi:MAG TPA: pyrroline-5-carboxylate reductase [Opitutaceae bacterium]|nr:pyrroline-5-carboxylate reductase [Opitutaceae bacterium]
MAQIAFLGAGNMAAAMVDGLLAQNVAAKTDLVCFSGSGKTAAALAARTGIAQAHSLAELLARADTLVVAFKPQHLAAADPQLAELTAGKLVLSVLAGKKLPRLAQAFPRARDLVRTMPNTPGQIGAGMTGWCAHRPLAPADRAIVERLLGALGQALEIAEAEMDALTAISGCGPAYLFEFAAALRDAGVAAGLEKSTAEKLTVETLLGAARLLARKNVDPEILRNQVTSPNGVTFAGLKRMEAHDFRGMIRDTILTAKARSEELSKDG